MLIMRSRVTEVGGRPVIVFGNGGTIRPWDLGTGQPLFALPLGASIRAV